MARQRHLTRSPITEAIVDVRASVPDDSDLSRLEAVKEAMKGELPLAETMRDLDWSSRRDSKSPESSGEAAARPRGFILRSEDGTRVAKIRPDGFALIRLAPYPGWKPVFADARKLLAVYFGAASATRVLRVAIRFVNRMLLANDARPLSARFAGLPAVPKGSPRELVDYTQRMVTRDSRRGTVASVQQTIERSELSRAEAMILDVEAYVERRSGLSIAEVERRLEELRRVKNRIFFSFISERTAREYE